MKTFEGVFTALITPFHKDKIDEPSLRNLVQHQLANGVQGFVINGTTAESPTLLPFERELIWKIVKSEVGNRVPLLFGTGSNSTAQTIENTKLAEKMGADGALVVVPYYNKPPQRGLFEHFKQVAGSVSIPILLYNVPGRTVVSLQISTIVELSLISNIVGIKEASGNLSFGRELLEKPKKSFLVSSGDDETFLDLMKEGGRGVISVVSHVFPKEIVGFSKRVHVDPKVRSEFEKYERLTKLLFQEANPIPVKAALKMMGLITSDEVRLPLVPCSEKLKADLREEMSRLGVIK